MWIACKTADELRSLSVCVQTWIICFAGWRSKACGVSDWALVDIIGAHPLVVHAYSRCNKAVHALHMCHGFVVMRPAGRIQYAVTNRLYCWVMQLQIVGAAV